MRIYLKNTSMGINQLSLYTDTTTIYYFDTPVSSG